jgi:ATP-dependent helicase/DNAse subunit B
VAGETAVEYKGFLGELRSTLEGNYSPEPILLGQPAVLVLRVLEARGLRFRAVAVLGLSEGVFPEVEREDPFISEKVRAEFRLEPRLEREQAGLFYQAVTRADQFLLLTRPTLADDGERWEPSPYWNAATSLFMDPPVLIRPDDPRPLADGASSEEVLFSAVRRGSLTSSFGELLPRFEQLRHARDVLHARLAREAAGPFEGDLSAAQDTLVRAFGPEHVWSPSRLESYGTCPHLFFAAHALKLEPREPPQVGLDPLQLGKMLHAILEKAYCEAEDPGDPESVLTSVRQVARAEFAAAPQHYGFRPSALWDIEQAYFLDRLIETVRGSADLGDGWVPTALESSFGRDEIPPLELNIDGGPVLLRGVIDRVDTNQNGQLRVLDYKTGSSHLAPQDLVDGQRLQLPLYALAARDALELGEPIEGLYWAILAGRAGSLRLSRFNHEAEDVTYRGPAGAAQVALQHVGRILAGVRGGSFQPQPPRGGCPSYCPAAAWCWRFAPSMW